MKTVKMRAEKRIQKFNSLRPIRKYYNSKHFYKRFSQYQNWIMKQIYVKFPDWYDQALWSKTGKYLIIKIHNQKG